MPRQPEFYIAQDDKVVLDLYDSGYRVRRLKLKGSRWHEFNCTPPHDQPGLNIEPAAGVFSEHVASVIIEEFGSNG